MVRLIFMVVAFLMLVGGVIGGLYFWGFDPLAKFNALLGNAPVEQSKDAPKPLIVTPPSYVQFGLLIIPVVLDREVKKQAEFVLRLEVPFDKKELVAQNLPRLQNAYLADMMEFLPTQLRNTYSVDNNAVRKKLIQSSESVLGRGLVKDVLIEQATVK